MNILKRFARYILRQELADLKTSLTHATRDAEQAVNLSGPQEVKYTLTKEVFHKAIAPLENAVVTDNTSPTAAAYKLGIQRAINQMREAFVHG